MLKKGSVKKRRPTVCLAIPTYNRESVLLDSLRSTLRLRPKPHEILVIDQTSDHEKETIAFLKAAQRKGLLRWFRQFPPSLTEARNRALAETRCDIVIFIDDDVQLPKDFVAKHLRHYAEEDVQAVAGGVRQEKKPVYPPGPPGGWPRLFDYKYFSVYDQRRNEAVATFMGCNHSARVARLLELGGYDTRYRGSAFREDTDMAVRIWKSGGRIVFDPEARLVHLAAPSGGCRIPAQSQSNPEWRVAFNRHYFAFRHLFPRWEFWKLLLFRDFRETVLRKANVLKPWRIPWALLSYIYSVGKALREALARRREDSRTAGSLRKA